MASRGRGRGRRGRPRGTGQALPVFDQQAFAEAVGIAAVGFWICFFVYVNVEFCNSEIV